MQVQSKKAKGRSLQKLIVQLILNKFSELQPEDVRSTSMGAQGEDILLSAQAQRLFPYAIEAKNQEGFSNVYNAYEQACSHSNGRVVQPLLVIKSNRKKPLVIMDLEYFIARS